jgi:cation diffusion facilitator family transporter
VVVDGRQQQRILIRFMLLSLGAAVATIVLKLIAAAITGSVGLLSDAMESGVNLVAALVALWALRLAARPPDAVHQFGHGKAEYLSAAVEGGMVFVAATVIVVTSVRRLVDPVPLESAGLGLAVSALASGINLAVGLALLRTGRRHRSITLEADGRHLLTDVVTSAGVLVGVALVAIFDLELLDPIVALLVGVNILFTGYQLVQRSISGILDAALPAADVAEIESLLDRYRAEGIDFHALRTRESGRQRFVYVHVLVPDDWTVKHGHDAAERFKTDLAALLPDVITFAHVEPRDDPASYGHEQLHPHVPPLDPPSNRDQ